MKNILTVVGILILLNGFHAALVVGCSFDTDCQPGSRCLKAPGAIYGVCGGGISPGNTYDRQPVYDPLDPNRTVGNTCSFDTDCGPGNRRLEGEWCYLRCLCQGTLTNLVAFRQRSSGRLIAAAYLYGYKEITMNELQDCVVQALKMLLQYDSDLIKTQPKEECINHKLAQYLELVLHEKTLLEGRDVDIEYNKYKEDEKKSSDGRNIRPDIIVHERKSGNRNNLIVIEAKKNYDTKRDRNKVTELVNSENFRYTVGAIISYFPKKEYVKIKFLTPDGSWKKYLLNKRDFTIKETER